MPTNGSDRIVSLLRGRHDFARGPTASRDEGQRYRFDEATLYFDVSVNPHSDFITFAAACTVFSMSVSLCAVEMKPASNWDGAM